MLKKLILLLFKEHFHLEIMRYLLIDLSYFVFYRYYAIVNYIKLSTKTSPNLDNVLEDELFVSKFEEMFEKTLLKLVKTHYSVKNLNSCTDLQIIFVKDCCRSDIWRLEYYPLYKANRDHSKKKDRFDGMIFEHVYKVILPELIKKYHCVYDFFVHHSEADDCIAIITDCSNENDSVIIITNDNDYIQLFDKVDGIYNLQGKNLNTKLVNGCSRTSMFYKVLIGDPSDNIKGVCSKTKAMNILSKCNHIDDIYTFIEKTTDNQRKTFEFNKHLIDFTNIPIYLKENIENRFKTNAFKA